jgi:hypothetical protein
MLRIALYSSRYEKEQYHKFLIAMTITYQIFNSLNSINILRIEMPWDYQRAAKGFYSSAWKNLKIECANNCKLDKRFIKAQIAKTRKITSRMIVTMPNGVVFNSPFDLSSTDKRIIDLHLQALMLSKI